MSERCTPTLFLEIAVGYGCLRLEPQLMVLGQAAGVAAAQALAQGVDVQDIDVARLQARLRTLGAKIDM